MDKKKAAPKAAKGAAVPRAEAPPPARSAAQVTGPQVLLLVAGNVATHEPGRLLLPGGRRATGTRAEAIAARHAGARLTPADLAAVRLACRGARDAVDATARFICVGSRPPPFKEEIMFTGYAATCGHSSSEEDADFEWAHDGGLEFNGEAALVVRSRKAGVRDEAAARALGSHWRPHRLVLNEGRLPDAVLAAHIGPRPGAPARLRELRWLDLDFSRPQVTRETAVVLAGARLPALEVLTLRGARITAGFAEGLADADWPALTELRLDGTRNHAAARFRRVGLDVPALLALGQARFAAQLDTLRLRRLRRVDAYASEGEHLPRSLLGALALPGVFPGLRQLEFRRAQRNPGGGSSQDVLAIAARVLDGWSNLACRIGTFTRFTEWKADSTPRHSTAEEWSLRAMLVTARTQVAGRHPPVPAGEARAATLDLLKSALEYRGGLGFYGEDPHPWDQELTDPMEFGDEFTDDEFTDDEG